MHSDSILPFDVAIGSEMPVIARCVGDIHAVGGYRRSRDWHATVVQFTDGISTGVVPLY